MQGADGFAALGYSTGSQMIDPACSVHSESTPGGTGTWLHDCGLEAGDSGGPIIRRGTVAVVALSAGVVTDPTDPQCPSGGVHHRGTPLARWSVRCASMAVPLTPKIIDRVQAASIAVGVQRALCALGYDAGPLGAIDEPRAIAAIKQVQGDMGWAVTGEPTDALRKILWLKIPTS
jgi:hypothetical protein